MSFSPAARASLHRAGLFVLAFALCAGTTGCGGSTHVDQYYGKDVGTTVELPDATTDTSSDSGDAPASPATDGGAESGAPADTGPGEAADAAVDTNSGNAPETGSPELDADGDASPG